MFVFCKSCALHIPGDVGLRSSIALALATQVYTVCPHYRRQTALSGVVVVRKFPVLCPLNGHSPPVPHRLSPWLLRVKADPHRQEALYYLLLKWSAIEQKGRGNSDPRNGAMQAVQWTSQTRSIFCPFTMSNFPEMVFKSFRASTSYIL
jgi:hypothetical protein